jgi:hypothetical protein
MQRLVSSQRSLLENYWKSRNSLILECNWISRQVVNQSVLLSSFSIRQVLTNLELVNRRILHEFTIHDPMDISFSDDLIVALFDGSQHKGCV